MAAVRGAANSHSSLSYLEVNTKSNTWWLVYTYYRLKTPKHPHKRGGRVEGSRPDDRGRPARAECVIPGDPERKPDSLNT